MGERDWLTSGDHLALLAFLHASGRLSARKDRLFAAACCRRLWPWLEKQSRWAVATIEKVADGQGGERKRARAEARAWAVSDHLTAQSRAREIPHDAPELYAATAVRRLTASVEQLTLSPDFGRSIAARVMAETIVAEWRLLDRAERERAIAGGEPGPKRALCDLLRDLFGNPFRSTPLDLAWLTPVVTAVARATYNDRAHPGGGLDNSRLAVLADALEDAGCTNADVLNHLRSPGPHVRGCWVVDACLGAT